MDVALLRTELAPFINKIITMKGTIVDAKRSEKGQVSICIEPDEITCEGNVIKTVDHMWVFGRKITNYHKHVGVKRGNKIVVTGLNGEYTRQTWSKDIGIIKVEDIR